MRFINKIGVAAERSKITLCTDIVCLDKAKTKIAISIVKNKNCPIGIFLFQDFFCEFVLRFFATAGGKGVIGVGFDSED
ncbi:MAG: hypothetical protein CSA45_05425 [Gammaproteobacteria bacterium]|nr:MAG: hypothetical protein CSA45_05425 [Gammaproteobacteria bacterium]